MKEHPQAAAIAAAVAGRDSAGLAAAVTDTVRLRALLPGGPIQVHGRDDVVACFGRWFADMDTVEVVESAGEPVADRLLIHYQLELAQNRTRWACTQTSDPKANRYDAQGNLSSGTPSRHTQAEHPLTAQRRQSTACD